MNDKTKEVEFDYVPADDVNIAAVKAGVRARWALSNAGCIEDSVAYIIERGVEYEEMRSAEVAWLMGWALRVAAAYRAAAGAVA